MDDTPDTAAADQQGQEGQEAQPSQPSQEDQQCQGDQSVAQMAQMPATAANAAAGEVQEIAKNAVGVLMGGNIDTITGLKYVPNQADVEAVARIAHEACRAYDTGLGDEPLSTWEEANHDVHRAAINSVEFLVDNPAATASDEHDAFLKKYLDEGWKFGKKKDQDKKTHPDLVPYDKLPKDVQAKYVLFHAVAHGTLQAITEACDNLLAQYLNADSPILAIAQEQQAQQPSAFGYDLAAANDSTHMQFMSLGLQNDTCTIVQSPTLGPRTLEEARALPAVSFGSGEPYEALGSWEITSFKTAEGVTAIVVQLADGSLAQEPLKPTNT